MRFNRALCTFVFAFALLALAVVPVGAQGGSTPGGFGRSSGGSSLLHTDTTPVRPTALNPIAWKTDFAKLTSGDFNIRIGNTYYYGNDAATVRSDSGEERGTLEVTWFENNTEMRVYVYFRMRNAGEWEMYDLRTYNGRGDWIYYNTTDTNGNGVSSLRGQQMYVSGRTFAPKTASIDAELYCGNGCAFTAFTAAPRTITPQGYSLEMSTGLRQGEVIKITTDPMSGYGVNAILRDTSGNVVTNQSDMTYEWTSSNESVAKVSSITIPSGNACAYGIQRPCPKMNGQIGGHGVGTAMITVRVLKSGTELATNALDVLVRAHVTETTPEPDSAILPTPTATSNPPSRPNVTSAPTPMPTLDPEAEALKREVEALKGQVGEIELDVARQGRELNVLQRAVRAIQDFFARWFGTESN